MEELRIRSQQSDYKAYIDSNFEGFKHMLANKYRNSSRRLFITAEDKAAVLYSEIIKFFKEELKAEVFTFQSGEESKNIDTISRMYRFLIQNSADRSSVLAAFGGGVTGDLTAFAASTYMRGIGFINIPTTLTAQIDSSLGGKAGYNFGQLKNVIGAFYNPETVYVSTEFLKTLSREQLLDGMGEVVKYGLIQGEELLGFIEDNAYNILNLEETATVSLIKECLSLKADVIAKDYKDTGLRNILNFGHTIGHAIEVDSKYSIPHGTAVALGILAALKLSETKLNLSGSVYSRIRELYKKLSIPSRYKVDNYSAFLYAIKHDKKNTETINFVLLEAVGRCRIKIAVSEEEIFTALENSIFN